MIIPDIGLNNLSAKRILGGLFGELLFLDIVRLGYDCTSDVNHECDPVIMTRDHVLMM